MKKLDTHTKFIPHTTNIPLHADDLLLRASNPKEKNLMRKHLPEVSVFWFRKHIFWKQFSKLNILVEKWIIE